MPKQEGTGAWERRPAEEDGDDDAVAAARDSAEEEDNADDAQEGEAQGQGVEEQEEAVGDSLKALSPRQARRADEMRTCARSDMGSHAAQLVRPGGAPYSVRLFLGPCLVRCTQSAAPGHLSYR